MVMAVTGFAPQSAQIAVNANQLLKKTRHCVFNRRLTKNSSQPYIR